MKSRLLLQSNDAKAGGFSIGLLLITVQMAYVRREGLGLGLIEKRLGPCSHKYGETSSRAACRERIWNRRIWNTKDHCWITISFNTRMVEEDFVNRP